MFDEESEKYKEFINLVGHQTIARVLIESNIRELRDIQVHAIKKGLFFRNSFLICAPSGSGKTLIGEICAVSNIFQGFGKSIYLVPFKALATEKYNAFKKSYQRFNIKVVLSIGDFDVDDKKLANADIIITTYEKMDSILRNFFDKEWIFEISTIIIDEIHMVGESGRGPRLESLIVRLNEFLHHPQIIGLSATIANPQFFTSWLTSLGNETTLIASDKRPVPLHYRVELTQNKDSTIKKLVKDTLGKEGQVLIFLKTRKATQQLADTLKNLVRGYIKDAEHKLCEGLKKELEALKDGNSDLRKVIKYGIAFHHAGLLPKERRIVEDNFRSHHIKVICCTTTLSAGVNVPARVVILKDFKKFVTSGYNIKNFAGFHENGDGFSYFKAFSANEIFQMLGRAGRPGMDVVGYGYLLAKDLDGKMFIEDHYFQNYSSQGKRIPKYNDLTSELNNINILKEQVLLRVYEAQNITIEKLKQFFEKTYFWYSVTHKLQAQNIPIDQFLMINEVSPENILKLHSNPQTLRKLQELHYPKKISKITSSTILGHIKTDYGVYTCQFDIEEGIKCSCGFQNGLSDNFAGQKFAFEFCSHVSMFLLYLIELPDKNFEKYVNDIIPKSVRNQYVLNYLFEKGLIIRNEDGTLKCSHFGKLIIRLYLYPASGVLIRYKLEHKELNSFKALIEAAYDVLKAEFKVRDKKMLEPLLEWTDEEPIDKILDRSKIMAGDFYSVRDNIERIITFIGTIARNLAPSDIKLQEKLIEVSEMAETLRIRVHHGIKEELFDLVLRLNNVGRVRARILYDVGYHTTTQVKKEKVYTLNRKTGLGINLCKKILESSKEKKKKEKNTL